MIGIHFDTSDLLDASQLFRTAARDLQGKVLVRSVNKIAAKGRTLAKREIAREGGFKSSYVNQRMSLRRAGIGPNPSATITAAGRYTTLTQFSPRPAYRPGGRLRRAKPWGENRTYKGFWVRGKNGAALPVIRRGKARHDYSVLYGPSVGRELARPGAQTPVVEMINRELPQETARYTGYLLSR